jgi:hypothetical protein
LNGLEGAPEEERNFAIGGATRVMTAAYLSKRIALISMNFNPLNAELNPICHLLAIIWSSPYSARNKGKG